MHRYTYCFKARSGRDPAPIDTAAKHYFIRFSPSERRR